jgi:hypothetical protein
MTTRALKNVCAMSHSHEVQVVGARDEPLDKEDVVRELWTGCPRPRDVPPRSSMRPSFGETSKWPLELQSLSLSLAIVGGKPSFCG